jgi:VIT1/CCC1 family predicted Fe2+/Mn2+ transporter
VSAKDSLKLEKKRQASKKSVQNAEKDFTEKINKNVELVIELGMKSAKKKPLTKKERKEKRKKRKEKQAK